MRRLVLCFMFWVVCFMFFSYKMGFSVGDALNCVVGIALITLLVLIPFMKFKGDGVVVQRNEIHKDDEDNQ